MKHYFVHCQVFIFFLANVEALVGIPAAKQVIDWAQASWDNSSFKIPSD